MIKLNGKYYVTQHEFVECIGVRIPDTTFVDFTRLDSLNTKLAKLSPLFKVLNGDNYFELDDLGLGSDTIYSVCQDYVTDIVTAFNIFTVTVNADIRYRIPVFVKSSIVENTPVNLDVNDMFILKDDVLEYLCVKIEELISAEVLQEFDNMERYLAGNYFTSPSSHMPIFGVKNFTHVVLQQLMDANCFKNSSIRVPLTTLTAPRPSIELKLNLDFDGDTMTGDEVVFDRIVKLRDAFDHAIKIFDKSIREG